MSNSIASPFGEMPDPKPKRLFFSSVRLAVRDHQMPFEQLQQRMYEDFELIAKGGEIIYRGPCWSIPVPSMAMRPLPGDDVDPSSLAPSALDLGRELEPDKMETVRIPEGLTAVFDCTLEFAGEDQDDFAWTIWFHGNGERMPFAYAATV